MCAKQRIRTRTRGVHHGTKHGLMSWGGEFGEVLGVLRAALGAARLEAPPQPTLPMEGGRWCLRASAQIGRCTGCGTRYSSLSVESANSWFTGFQGEKPAEAETEAAIGSSDWRAKIGGSAEAHSSGMRSEERER